MADYPGGAATPSIITGEKKERKKRGKREEKKKEGRRKKEDLENVKHHYITVSLY